MKKRKKLGRKLLSFLLTLALVLGLMPGMGLTAYAAPTETLLTTITATGKEQANYSTANVATVSFSYTAGGSSAYVAIWGWWGYGWTATVTAAEGYTITKCVFYDDKDRTATDSEAPFVVETTEEDKTPQVNGTPILAYTSKGIKKIEVYGYATPTATHSVTITAGDHMTKTTGSGEASQTGLSGAMTDVVYTANEGYYFPENYSVTAVNGISVTRNSYTQITVSGTPTADAAIALTAPTAKTTPDAPKAAATDCTTADNNDGKLTGVTTEMEYKKSDATEWTAGTGSDITGLVPGTYYVRVKATDTTNASGNQELTIKGFISYTVTFTVVNGKWNDETTTDKTVTLTGYEGDTLKLAATDIPAVGSKPNNTYKAGSWDTTPSADTEITGATTYTYTYAQKDSISQTVTFKVVNGSWNDETTTDKTVTLTGYEGDTLKLAAADIPAVGTKPNDTYKAGSWDVTPSTDTAITADTTYTYTYAQKDAISQTVTFKVVNGKWDDDSTADKTVTLTGYEGDTLKLAATDIPAVGTKPSDTYKAGSWDVTPSTDTVITAATTYTYTYAAKEASVVTKAPEAKTLTYTGSAQELVTAGEATGGEMQYALGDANGATQPYTTSIPTATNAETYYVWYKVVGDSNHNDLVATTPVTAEIAKAAINITADDKSTQYGADIAELTYVVSGAYVTGDDLGVTVSTTATNASPVNTYPISISWNNNANYTATLTNGTYTITKADLTVSASGYSGTYDGQAHGISVDVGNSGATVYYGTAELTEQNYSNAGSTTNPTYTDAGTYTVYYYVTATNYDPQPVKGSQTVTIAKANVELTMPSAATLTYDGSDRALVSGGSVTGGSFAYALGENGTTAPAGDHAWNAGVPTGKNAGTYYVWYKGVGDGNHYDSTPDCITVTIGKKAATISANAASKTYGDADPPLTATVTGTVGNDTLNYTLGRTAGENVDGYTITVTANAADNPNYDITTNNGTFTINKKALTITADSATKVYDATALTKNSYTNTALATGDSIESVTITGTQTAAGSSANVPSAAVIKNGGTDVTANYQITYENGTLTVTKATTNTVTVDITGWTYGDSANAPTSEASFGANTVTYSYSNAQDGTYTATVPVNAGTWYVKASVAGTANYVEGEATKSFTIAKREVVVSGIVAVDKNYDGTNTAPLDFSKVSIANLVAADAGKLSVTATGTFEDEKVGKDKKVTISDLALSGEAAGNYVLAAEGQQTESKADISNMTTETGSGTDGNGDFIARVEDFNLNIKKVEGLDLELGKALCTPAELAMYEAGAKIELDLEIRVAEGLMTDDAVSKVTGILWNQEHVTMHGAKYFDITLYKKVGDADPVKVTDLGDKSITIRMGVPEDMKNTNSDKTRTFFMVRMHDGEAAVLTRTTSEELTFNTSLFSTYAICYNDAPVWSPTQQTPSSNNTVTATVVAPKTSGTDETARTLLVFGTAFAVAAIVSWIYVFGRRKEEEE